MVQISVHSRSSGFRNGSVQALVLLAVFLDGAAAQPATVTEPPQRKLYLLHCAVCHGELGNGDGRAARFVFPKPRDFTTGKMRLVRTVNRVASDADIRNSIERGFPGTSMQAWKYLGDESIDKLVAEVIRLREDGVRRRLQQSIQEGDALAEPPNVENIVQTLTVAGKAWEPPPFGEVSDASIERGRQVYLKQSCNSCHGKNGDGSWKMDLVDDKGRPSWATDLRFDPFKGNIDPLAIARRIVLGMPGSSMPSSGQLTDPQLVDLVRFCESLAAEPKYELTNHQRAQRAVGFRRPAEPQESP
jgi:mono/diheme cytochrome c family protein